LKFTSSLKKAKFGRFGLSKVQMATLFCTIEDRGLRRERRESARVSLIERGERKGRKGKKDRENAFQE